MNTYYIIVAPRTIKTNTGELYELQKEIGWKKESNCVLRFQGEERPYSLLVTVHNKLSGQFKYIFIKEPSSQKESLYFYTNDSYLDFCIRRFQDEGRFSYHTLKESSSEVLRRQERLVRERARSNESPKRN